MINEVKTTVNKLTPIGIFNGRKEKNKVISVDNSDIKYTKNSDKQKKEKYFSLNSANNYVYLGSTNMPLLNNMGVTLSDDGDLILIKGKTHDLFTGLYQKYMKGGFKYNVFNIDSKNSNNIKFKELYVNSEGFLIGNKRTKNELDNVEGNNCELYKIKFKQIEKEYNLNDDTSNNVDSKFIVEYEKYIVEEHLKQDLSSINNVIELKENNVLKVNRKGLDIIMEIKDNQLFTTGLPATLESYNDEVDSNAIIKKHKVKLPLKETDKILAIKPILNQIQLVVDKGNKIKIYYLDPLNIFAIKNYQYEVTRLKQEPPLSFYSMIGENNYKNYHSGQPFSTQTIGNFSSQHIPFFSSIIDNARVHIDKAKQQYALKKYTAMAVNIAKSIDPGFRGLFSNIKALINSSILPHKNKNIALYGVRKNISKDYAVLNKVIKGINNGKTQGEIIYSLVNELKEQERIIINHANDIRAFFGINAFYLPGNIGVNAFVLAHYAKTHSLMLSKNEKEEVIFSFINTMNTDITAGLSAGVGGFNQRWKNNNIDYGVVTPIMASTLLNVNYDKQSNFSFKIGLENVSEFINQGLDISEDLLKYNSTLEGNEKLTLLFGNEIRSEMSFNVDVSVNPNTGVTIPRNAIGANIVLNFLKLDLNINKFIGYGEIESKTSDKNINLNFFDLGFEFYRDLKFTPSTTSSTNSIQWYPLATIKNFEIMAQKKINSLFNMVIFDSRNKQDKKEFEKNKKELKGIYKRVLKINKLFDTYPNQYDVSNKINKLDDISLALSSDKKSKNKLSYRLSETKFDFINQIIKKPISLVSENKKIKQFLLDLKERKETLSSQEKDNMNEKFKPYVISKYKLDHKSVDIYIKNKIKIKNILEEVKNNENITLYDIKNKLDELYNECKKELDKIEYQLDSVEVMSVSELAEKTKSLPLFFLRLGSRKTIIHHQVKGEIKFFYDKNKEQLENISAKYYF
ncbi:MULTISPECIES: hypothetical protein [Gammaproteobacteria]|uniref:hypothetical protein n=1 Tax=Gammaproteobacteria TaxID=1236 RepID=UPI00186651C3|nr:MULTISPECIES: hypothetical protein [Gammaproteobacteria]